MNRFLTHTNLPQSLDEMLSEEIHREVMPNGLTVLYKEVPSSPVCSVNCFIRAGSIHEGDLLGCGVSHFVEHMCFKGTTRRTFKEIAREVHSVGGSSNANTSYERTLYYINTPPEGLELALDVLEDQVFHSRIPEEEFASEREVILREIDMVNDDPDWKLAIKTLATVFRKSPLKYPVIGYKDLFESITRDELKGYYERFYLPNNAVLSMAGPQPVEVVRDLWQKKFSDLRMERLVAPFEQEEAAQMGLRRERLSGSFEVSRGVVAIPVPGRGSLDFPAVRVLADTLGGGESSRLWTRLRNQEGIVDSISADVFSLGSEAMLWINYTCEPSKEDQAEAGIFSILGELPESLPGEEEVEVLKQKTLTSEVRARQRAAVEANRIGTAETLFGDQHLVRTQMERLYGLRAEELGPIVSSYLLPHRTTSVRLGPPIRKASQLIRKRQWQGEVMQTELPGGIRLVEYSDDRLPIFNLRLMFEAGPNFDAPGKAGLGALGASLLTKDAGDRSAEEVARRVESVGGDYSSSSGNNSTNLSLLFQSDHLEIAGDLLSQAILAPRFRKETFEVERGSLISEIEEGLDDPATLGVRELRKRFFTGHRFGTPAEGSPESLGGLNLEDLRDWYERGLPHRRMVVSVAGKYDRTRLLESLGQIIENWKLRSDSNELVEEADFEAATGVEEMTVMRDQAVIFDGWRVGGYLSDDYRYSLVANQLFSGLASRLFEEVRERRGLAYYVSSLRILGLHQGCFALYAGCHPERRKVVWEEFEKEMQRMMRVGPELDELADAKFRLISAKRMGLESISAKALEIGSQALFNLPPDLGEGLCREIASVELDGLRDWFGAHFGEEKRFRFAVVGG
ncbi:MAG: M16 family metallopeptidase [Puniceicoccaceae bacterium]